jgi:ribosome-associated protein
MSDIQNATPRQSSADYSTTTQPYEDAALDLAMTIAHAADERKATDIRILKVTDVSYIADYFVIVTGLSSTQVRAISSSVVDSVSEALERKPLRTEGQFEGSWILQDYGEVIVHIFMPEARDYYELEAFWGHAEDVSFESA